MKLHEALHFALGRVRSDQACVTLAREGARSYQVRVLPDHTILRGYRVSVRHWAVETAESRSGSRYLVHEGWRPWAPFSGFSADDVVADDWKVMSTETP